MHDSDNSEQQEQLESLKSKIRLKILDARISTAKIVEEIQRALEVARAIGDAAECKLLEGWCLLEKGSYAAAETALDAGMSLKAGVRTRSELAECLGLALLYQNKPIPALRVADEALLNDKDSPQLHYVRGCALLYHSRYDEAIAEFESVDEDSDKWLPATTNISYAHYHSGRRKETFEYLRKAVGIAKRLGLLPDPFLLNNLGVLLHEQSVDTGDRSLEEEARKCYLKAIRAARFTAEAFYNLGLSGLREHAILQAEGMAENALASAAEARERFSRALEGFSFENSEEGVLSAALLYALAGVVMDLPEGLEASDSRLAHLTLRYLLEDMDNFVRKRKENYVREERSYFKAKPKFPLEAESASTPDMLVVLKRWEIGTAPLPSALGPESSGGFFLTYQGRGVVIDPGPGFLASLNRQGIPLSAIDYVFVTHPHISHSRDLEPLLLCLEDMKSQWNYRKTVTLLATRDVVLKYGDSLRASSSVEEVVVLLAGRSKVLEGDPAGVSLGIKVDVLETARASIGEMEGPPHVGLLLTLECESGPFRIAYTSDTTCYDGYSGQLNGKPVDILILSVGRITFKELISLQGALLSRDQSFLRDQMAAIPEELVLALGFGSAEEFRSMLLGSCMDSGDASNRQQLGFLGALRVVSEVKPRLAVLASFKPELGVLRHRVAEAFQQHFRDTSIDTRFLTGDTGLMVRIPELDVYCDLPGEFKAMTSVREVPSRSKEGVVARFWEECEPEEIAEYGRIHWGRPKRHDLLEVVEEVVETDE